MRMDNPIREMEREAEERRKLEAEAKERARLRVINQTKHVRCTLLHGSRIGMRRSKTGYGLGITDDGGHALIHRLVGVQYAEQHEDEGPESSPDQRFGPLHIDDRVVKVGERFTPSFAEALESIQQAGAEPLELTVLRDPNQAPGKLWRRDRLWNYSQTAYWLVLAALLLLALSLLTFIAYKLSQLEQPPPGNRTDSNLQYDPITREYTHARSAVHARRSELR